MISACRLEPTPPDSRTASIALSPPRTSYFAQLRPARQQRGLVRHFRQRLVVKLKNTLDSVTSGPDSTSPTSSAVNDSTGAISVTSWRVIIASAVCAERRACC